MSPVALLVVKSSLRPEQQKQLQAKYTSREALTSLVSKTGTTHHSKTAQWSGVTQCRAKLDNQQRHWRVVQLTRFELVRRSAAVAVSVGWCVGLL